MALAGGLAGYLGLLALLYFSQTSLLYPASREAPDPALAEAAGLRTIETLSADGLKLHHWYKAPPQGALLVVVFHGNAGHRGDRLAKYRFFVEAGYGLLLAGYRGYGDNPGSPSEPYFIADGRALIQWLHGQGIAPERLVLYGESLGSGVAVALAAERPVKAIVLEAPFTSIAATAQHHYWYLPAKWLVRDPWNSLARIAKVSVPVMVLHGARDRTVPQFMGRALLAAVPGPKQGFFPDAAGHVDLFDYGAADEVVSFLRGLDSLGN
ncbi:MAG: alpha/beta hydrolase [Kiloniellales bacterium]